MPSCFRVKILHHAFACKEMRCNDGCRKEGPLSLDEVIKDYVRLAVDCENNTSNTKYCVAQMLQSAMEGAPGKALLAAANMREIWWALISSLSSLWFASPCVCSCLVHRIVMHIIMCVAISFFCYLSFHSM